MAVVMASAFISSRFSAVLTLCAGVWLAGLSPISNPLILKDLSVKKLEVDQRLVTPKWCTVL